MASLHISVSKCNTRNKSFTKPTKTVKKRKKERKKIKDFFTENFFISNK